MKKQAFGVIDLLIGLLIMSAVFLISANAFKDISTIKINSSNEAKSVQEHVNETVNEIETMRQQTLDIEQQTLRNEY